MSTIKSSAENLTLNADGANNDIIFQSNASTKVTLDGQNTRLGIGTATPAQSLDVIGNVSFGANSYGLVEEDGTTVRYKNMHSGGTLNIMTHDGNEDIQIDPSGWIRFETGGGNRLRIDDDGIKFGSDTAAANGLDDYEEGTFTPVYTVVGGGSHSSVSAVNTGVYTKVGRMCTIGIKSYIVSTTGTVASYTVTLPFTGASGIASTGHGDEFAQGTGGCKLQIDGGVTMTIKENDNGSMPGNAYLALGITYQTA